MDLDKLKKDLKARFFKYKQDNKTSIGLDWGFSSLKIVILEPRNNTCLLKDARIIQLSSQDLDISSLFNDLSSLSGVNPQSCGINLGICGPNVIVRYVTMAKMGPDEFKNSLRYEAASYLPFPVEEVALDGVVLKDLPDNQMLVMLAAAKKDFINQRLKLFQEACIKVKVLDIDSLALINAFNFTHPSLQENNILSGAVALLNIGHSVTNINILEEGIPNFTRDINVAGNDFAKENSRETGIVNFASEVRKSFDYYEASSTVVINKIFLSGGGSLVSGLATDLREMLGMQIEQWDPFSNFEFTEGLDKTDICRNSAQFAVAVGLALR